MAHHIIYVPGIGDTKTTFQELAVRTWRLWGVVPHTYAMRWADGEPFEPKFARLLTFIDELAAQDQTVSLMGASAGATVVLNAYDARKSVIHGVVCVAGKVHRPHKIGNWYERNAPAFVQSAQHVQQPLAQLHVTADKPRIMSRYGIVDAIVPKQDSYIPGAVNRTVLGFGHVLTIAGQLTFGAPLWIHFLKKVA